MKPDCITTKVLARFPVDLDLIDEHDLVTVVVPARNEEQYIRNCLDSLRRQHYRNLEIIVVDGGSDDRTAEIVGAYESCDSRIRLIHNERRIVPVGLNLALAAARGRWLVRVDAHATVPPDYVGLAVHHLQSGDWGGVGGRKDGIGQSAAGRAIAAAMASPAGVGGSRYHYGTKPSVVDHIPFGAYPTELARKLGGWDERLAVNQDYEFDYRVRRTGLSLLFDPALAIRWHCREDVADLFRQYRRYGRGKVNVLRLHPKSARPRHLMVPALVSWLGFAALLSLRRPIWGTAVAAPYVAAVGIASAITGRNLDSSARRHVPAAFFAMHLGWGIGFWQGLADILRRGISMQDTTRPPPRSVST